MSVRLIAGRAGSGKTHWCLSQIRDRLAQSLVDDPRLILLVPEQAALQMERSLLAMSGSRVLGRCEVLSFRRLAHRILNEFTTENTESTEKNKTEYSVSSVASVVKSVPTVLSPYGRQMALRYLIGRQQRELKEFAKVAERGGFLSAIANSIAELFQEAVSIEQLEEAASKAESDTHPSAPRLADIALLYRAYLDYLGCERVDPEGVLDLARARCGAAPWLNEAMIWVDGFAGLTGQQLRMLVTLAQRAASIDIALLMDPEGDQRALDDLSLFARTEHTWSVIVGAMRKAGVSIDRPVYLGKTSCPRFLQSPLLGRLERNLFTAGSDSSPANRDSQDAILLGKAPDRRTEVAAAVTRIIDLVQRPTRPLRFRDIAIVVRDLEPYHDLISSELGAHRIPFFIDRRRPTFHHPLIQAVRAVVAMHGESRLDQSIGGLLKTGLSPLSDHDADALENYVLAHGLVAPATWDERWTYSPPGRESDTKAVENVTARLAAIDQSRERLRDAFGEWWPSDATRRSRPTCRQWVERLYALLERIGSRQRLDDWCAEAARGGDLDEREEHEQVWADLMKLFDEMVAALGDENMTPRQFRDCLESGLSQLSLGLVPATLDQVLVSSIERSRHPPVRAAFVLGFHDGLFPARVTEDNILTDDDRMCLDAAGVELPRTRRRRLLEERMLAYIAFTRPSEFLWVSYPAADERGRPLEPSPYWQSLCDALPGVKVQVFEAGGAEAVSTVGGLALGIAAWASAHAKELAAGDETIDPEWAVIYEWARENPSTQSALTASLASLLDKPDAALSSSMAKALWHAPFETSVTALEEFAWCPFKHYSARGLRLEPREIHEIAAVDMGRVFHGVLEQFVHEMMESDKRLADYSVQQIAASVDRLCKLAVPKYAERLRMDEPEKRKAHWRGRQVLNPALRALQKTLGRIKLQPARLEMPFGLKGDAALPALELPIDEERTVLVRGRIDRVDLARGKHGWIGFVFDYKRKLKVRLRLDQVYHGLTLQLVTYLIALRDLGRTDDGARIIPGGAFFLPLLGELTRVDSPAEADEPEFNSWKCFKPRGIIDFDALCELDSDFKKENATFAVYKKADGKLGYPESTDAVSREQLPLILEHVRTTMTKLSKRWIDGDIRISPARSGTEIACTNCGYCSVCRFEPMSRKALDLPRISQTEVLKRIAKEAKEAGRDG